MAYGLEIYNDGGFLQIADSVANYYVIKSGSVIVPEVSSIATAPNFGTSVTISNGTPFDAIAVSSTDRYVIPKSVFASETYSTNVVCTQSLTSGTLRYWLFRRYASTLPSTSGYGMELYNEEGELRFSTNYPKLMRSHSTIPVTDVSSTVQTYSLPTNRAFAFLAYGTSYTTMVAPTKASPDVKVPFSIQSFSGGVRSQRSNVRSGRLNNANPVYTGGMIALDVTNY